MAVSQISVLCMTTLSASIIAQVSQINNDGWTSQMISTAGLLYGHPDSVINTLSAAKLYKN